VNFYSRGSSVRTGRPGFSS